MDCSSKRGLLCDLGGSFLDWLDLEILAYAGVDHLGARQ